MFEIIVLAYICFINKLFILLFLIFNYILNPIITIVLSFILSITISNFMVLFAKNKFTKFIFGL